VAEISERTSPDETQIFPKLTEYLPGIRVVLVLRSSDDSCVKSLSTGVLRIERPRDDRARLSSTLGIEPPLLVATATLTGDPYRDAFLATEQLEIA